jgi:translation initiation factor 5A
MNVEGTHERKLLSQNSNCDSRPNYYLLTYSPPSICGHHARNMVKRKTHLPPVKAPRKIAHEIPAAELSKHQFILISDRPCRITSITLSVDSPATLHIIGTDITTALFARSFRQNPQQTYSLHCIPTTPVPVPKITSIRADRLVIGDYVLIKEELSKITDITISKVAVGGQKVHVVATEVFSGEVIQALMWDKEMVEWPEVKKRDLELLDMTEDRWLEAMASDGSVEAVRVISEELGKDIRAFWGEGKREVWVRVLEATEEKGVIEAFEGREMEVSNVDRDGSLALKRGGAVDMVVNTPGGKKLEQIKGFLQDGKGVMVKIRAAMGQEVHQDKWVVVEVRAMEISSPLRN